MNTPSLRLSARYLAAQKLWTRKCPRCNIKIGQSDPFREWWCPICNWRGYVTITGFGIEWTENGDRDGPQDGRIAT